MDRVTRWKRGVWAGRQGRGPGLGLLLESSPGLGWGEVGALGLRCGFQ